MEQCQYHPLMQERVGRNESEIAALKSELEDINGTLALIYHKLDTRYPTTVMWIMTVMSGTIGVLATVIISKVL